MSIRWLVEGLIPVGYLVLLAGSPKAGKTCFATALALAVANGVPFAGCPTRQAAVLWIAAEESQTERQVLLEGSPLVEASVPLYTCYQHLPIDDPETISLLYHWVNKTQAGLIVVDPLLGAIQGRSLSDSWSARRSLQPLKDMCRDSGITALVLHHEKSDRIRGKRAVADNPQLAAVASMSIVLTSSPAHIRKLPEPICEL